MSKLSDRLVEAKGDRSLDDVVAQAEQRGHSVHRATFAKYFVGDHAKNPRESVLKALADGLDLKVTELRRLAGKPAGELGPYQPPAFADRLDGDQRKALDELIRTIVERKKGDDHGSTNEEAETQKRLKGVISNDTLQPKQSDYTTAARKGRSQGRALRKHLGKVGEEPQIDPNADDGGV